MWCCGVHSVSPTYLLQRVQTALCIDLVLAEGLDVLAADDGFLELFQPRPHETGQDQRVPLPAQPLPGSLSGVQLRLHSHRRREETVHKDTRLTSRLKKRKKLFNWNEKTSRPYLASSGWFHFTYSIFRMSNTAPFQQGFFYDLPYLSPQLQFCCGQVSQFGSNKAHLSIDPAIHPFIHPSIHPIRIIWLIFVCIAIYTKECQSSNPSIHSFIH